MKKVKVIVLSGLLVFLLVSSLANIVAAAERKNSFSRTYSQEALSHLPPIISGHPRLYLRRQPWESGPDLNSLRQARGEKPWKAWLAHKPLGRPGVSWALRYLLTGDESLVKPVIKFMKEVPYWPGRLAMVALCYDWVYHSPNFPRSDKKYIAQRMVKMAHRAMVMGEEYHDMWSHFGYRPPVDIAFAGLALYGDRPEAEKFIRLGGGYLIHNMLPGWQRTGGVYQGGWVYYDQGVQGLVEFVAAWSSATGQNLYREIDEKYGGWLRGHLQYLIAAKYPDGTSIDTSGFTNSAHDFYRANSALIIAGAYHDREALYHLKKFWGDMVGWRFGWMPYLFYTSGLRKLALEKPPGGLAKVWGKDGIGYVQMRTGWDENDTVIEFKCGDYFWSHQFQNQNSFTIYKYGRLAIQSGIYAPYFSPHTVFYYRPTLGSNSMLVLQPGEKTWIPPRAADQNGVHHDHGFIPAWGGQRVCYTMPRLGSAETCFTFDKYLYRLRHQHHFETGDLEAFEKTDDYIYVRGNATMAYNNPVYSYPGNKPKINLFTRELVFLNQKYLIIYDQVESCRKDYPKRWLLHSIGEPQLSSKPVHVYESGKREVYDAGLVEISSGQGRLFCQTVFPRDGKIEKIGGCADISAVVPGGNNRGTAVLSGEITGKFARISSSLATDWAVPEKWKIVFSDNEHYDVIGTLTGKDGTGSMKVDFISKSQSLFIPAKNWQGIPEAGDEFSFAVRSSSYRFRVGGHNVPPPVKVMWQIFHDGSYSQPGNWRIEVFPDQEAKRNDFLHLLYPCKNGTVFENKERGIVSADGTLKGILIDNYVVMFNGGKAAKVSYSYHVAGKGKIKHVIVGLVRNHAYEMSISEVGTKTAFTKQAMTASPEGTLVFATPADCKVFIKGVPN